MHRIRGISSGNPQTSLPHGATGAYNVVFVVKKTHQQAAAHASTSFSSEPTRADADGVPTVAAGNTARFLPTLNTPLTSLMAITGTKRQNRRKQVKNRPKLPTKVATSIPVGT